MPGDDADDDFVDDDFGGASGEAEPDDGASYEWVSTNGGCPQCEAMDGQIFDFLPDRPHDNCDCEVRWVRAPSAAGRGRGDCESTWEIEFAGNTRYGPGFASVQTHWRVVITCWDGSQFETVLSVDHGDAPLDDDWELEAWNELYDEVEEIVAQSCPECEEPGVA